MKKSLITSAVSAIFAAPITAIAQTATTPPAELTPPSWPVSGIYTTSGTKDLGALTRIDWLSGIKVRGWIDSYYAYNRNSPDRAVVNANQGASVVKGRNVSIEGRTFDIHDQSFTLSLAEIEIEKVPERGGVGFKFDMAFGETQDVIVDTIRGGLTASVSDSVSDFDKTFQHASVSYLAPIGNGLRFDMGKFVTHIGGETIETVKNWNYSHSFFYTYAIPFQDNGIRMNYPVSDTLYGELYILNGWNVTTDNNAGKTWGPSIGWTPSPWLQVYANYLTGPEQADNTSNKRRLFDSQVILGPFAERWTFMVNYDIAREKNALAGKWTRWSGLAGYVRYKVSDGFEPSFRVERYRDRDGFTTGVPQTLTAYTLTLNTALAENKGSVLLLRPEIRFDRSDTPFFSKGSSFRSETKQATASVGVTWMF